MTTHSDASQLLLVDPKWRHAYGPLHDLLTVQGGVCAMCGVAADWVARRDGTTRCNLSQVSDPTTGLLLALVCRACVQELDRSRTGHSARAWAGASLLADAPARRCASTATSRPLTNGRRPCQDPWTGTEQAPPAWQYYSSVIHCLYLFQEGRCAICRCALTVASDPASVHVDHDPASTDQAVRGVLCRRCNNCEGQPYDVAEWWGPLAAVLYAYRSTPPASQCPDTSGLRMRGRFGRAGITRSPDGTVLLGRQVLIPAPSVLITDDDHQDGSDTDALER